MKNKSIWLADDGVNTIEGEIKAVAKKLGVCVRSLYNYHHENKKCHGYTIKRQAKIYELYENGELIDDNSDLHMLCICNGMDYECTLKKRIGNEVLVRYEWV